MELDAMMISMWRRAGVDTAARRSADAFGWCLQQVEMNSPRWLWFSRRPLYGRDWGILPRSRRQP